MRLAIALEERDPLETFTFYVRSLEIEPHRRAHEGVRSLMRGHPAIRFGREPARLLRLLEDPPVRDPESARTYEICRQWIAEGAEPAAPAR